jgi:hypothetical protein
VLAIVTITIVDPWDWRRRRRKKKECPDDKPPVFFPLDAGRPSGAGIVLGPRTPSLAGFGEELRGPWRDERNNVLVPNGSLPTPAGAVHPQANTPWVFGHIIAKTLGGPPTAQNFFWETHEANELQDGVETNATLLRAPQGRCFSYEVHLDYAGAAIYPTMIRIWWRDHPNATNPVMPGWANIPNYPTVSMLGGGFQQGGGDPP